MHFDVAIQNPPYDRNLHLKVLEQVLKVADTVINISPVRWLQDPFAPYSTKSDYCKFEESVSKKIETLDVISAKDASKLFDASFVMNLGIYVCSDKGGYAYQHNDSLVTKIVEKTMENSWAPYSQKKFYDEGCIQKKPYCLNLCGFGGSGKAELDIITCKSYQEQINTQLTNKKSVYTGGVGVSSTHFEFDTEAERRNFYNCYNHEFMKWTYRIWKSDVNVKAWKVPYFDDYTHKWKLRDFFNWFDLTPAERTRVVKEIRDMRHARFH